MSGGTRFRLFLDNAPASRAQIDQVEEIIVDQAVDTAWEARLVIHIGTDRQGVWGGADDAFKARFGRARVEVDPGNGTFVPLIDGPLVGPELSLSSEPGQSTFTAIVQDDSVFLNRDQRIVAFENRLDHEIARQVYAGAEQIADTDIDTDTRPPADALPPGETQRGTDMQLLRKLARRQGMHAYVLPGDRPGGSVGVFKPLPTEPDGLPPLVLLGADRNLESFEIREDAQAPASVRAQAVSLTDKSVTRATASFRDVRLLGDEAAGEGAAREASLLLPPGTDASMDAEAAVRAVAEQLSYAYRASGSVRRDAYCATLTPYRVVTVRGVGADLSGSYLISSVQHRLTRSEYRQSFSLRRNARSTGGAALSIPAGIF